MLSFVTLYQVFILCLYVVFASVRLYTKWTQSRELERARLASSVDARPDEHDSSQDAAESATTRVALEETNPRSAVAQGTSASEPPVKISAKKSGYYELDPHVHIERKPGLEQHLDLIQECRRLILVDEPEAKEDKFMMQDDTIWRYLAARKLDLQGARKQAVNAYKWRRYRNPDQIRAVDVQIELCTGKCALKGKDRHGRPVLVLDSSRENTWDANGNMRALTYQLGRIIRWMEKPVEKYVLVVRLGDTSMFNFSKLPGPSQVRETIRILMTVYAERLGHGILYMPPSIFTVFLGMFRNLMDAHVLSKVVWISGDVSENSTNDKSLKGLLGPHWRELIGEGQPVYNPKWVPGYNSPVEWEKIVKEEQDHLATLSASD